MIDPRAEAILLKLQDPGLFIDKCLNDLFFLCRSVLITLEDTQPGYKDIDPVTHRRICDFVQTYATEGNKVTVLTPRGWVKSYVITIGWTIQRMLRNLASGRREHQIISNATISNAMMFLEKIKFNLEYNELLRGLFDDVLPKHPKTEAEKWTLNEIQLAGNLIETGSVEGNLVSRHYKIMINDDLVNWDNSQTKQQLDKVLDWWKLAQSLLTSDGIEINIGTRWSYDDLYGYFIDKFIKPEKEYKGTQPIVELHNGPYHLLWMDCWSDPINEKGSTFPTLFPEEKLKKIQEEQGARFNGQYRNDPLALGRNPFNERWFVRWNSLKDTPSVRNTLMLIDPSGKASVDSDYTGITVIHLTPDRLGLIEYGKRHLITDRALAEWIIFNAPRWRPDGIYVEDNKYNVIVELVEMLVPQLIRMGKIAKEDLEYVKILPSIIMECNPRGRKKDWRIKNLTGMFENGQFRLPYNGAEDLEKELIRYPSMQDDCVDSLAYVMDFLVFPGKTDLPKWQLSVEEKMTTEERIEEEWKNLRESVTIGEHNHDFESFDDADFQ